MTSTRTIFVELPNKGRIDHLWRHDSYFVISYKSNKVPFDKVPNNATICKTLNKNEYDLIGVFLFKKQYSYFTQI